MPHSTVAFNVLNDKKTVKKLVTLKTIESFSLWIRTITRCFYCTSTKGRQPFQIFFWLFHKMLFNCACCYCQRLHKSIQNVFLYTVPTYSLLIVIYFFKTNDTRSVRGWLIKTELARWSNKKQKWFSLAIMLSTYLVGCNWIFL